MEESTLMACQDAGEAKKRKCLVSGNPTDPNILGPTQTFLKTFRILKSIFRLFLSIFIFFPCKKVFYNKKVCLSTDPKIFWTCKRKQDIFFFWPEGENYCDSIELDKQNF